MARVIPPHERPRKLAEIARLESVEDIEGWRMGIAMHGDLAEGYFPGEQDALAVRLAEIQRAAAAKHRGRR